MAFTDAQKVSIRRYLGYPLGYYQLSTALESMMDKVGGVATEQSAVETILAELVTIDALVATSGASASTLGSLKRADDIEWFNTTTESNGISVNSLGRGKMLIERLRQAFGVPLMGKYFGTTAPVDSEMALG